MHLLMICRGRRAPDNVTYYPTQRWNACHEIIKETPGDHLYIFDSCFSGLTGVMEKGIEKNYGPEVLAASSWDAAASGNPDTSFTRVLIDALNSLDGISISIASLFALIHQSAWANNIGAPPLHVSKYQRDSIVLRPLSQRRSDRQKSLRVEKLKNGEQRVLLRINLEGDFSDMDVGQWIQWLTTQMPSRIASVDIKLEAVFQSDSSIALITLPIDIYTMLDNSEEAMSFISYVRSSNLLRVLPENTLAVRPTGIENSPFSGSGGLRNERSK